MAITQETIRKITIQAAGQDSVDSMTGALSRMTAAQQTLTTAAGATATVTDIATKRQLSAEAAYKRQTMAVDATARAQDQYQRALRVTDAALRQGIITASQHADRVKLLQQRYLDAGSATKTLSGITDELSRAFGVATGVIAAFGVSLSISAMVAYGKSVFNTVADLHAQADQILGSGGNVEALQAFRNAFSQNGVAMSEGDKIVAKLTLTLGQAADGSQEAQDAFHRLGLGSKQLAGSTADAALPLVAAKLLTIKDATARATIETALFGKSGQQLESVLRALAQPLQQQIDQAKALGVVYDEDLAKKADAAKNSIEQSFQKLSVALAPYIVEWVSDFAQFTGSIDGSKSALDGLIESLKTYGAIGGGAYLGSKVPGPLPVKIGGAALGGAAGYMLTHRDQNTFANHLGDFDAGVPIDIPVPGQSYNRGFVLQSARNGYIESVTSSATRQSGSAPDWKLSQKDIDAYNKIKLTFAGFVAEEAEAARLAGESAAQRETELAIIKGAQIAQKENNVATRDTVKNYADAVKYLGQARAEQIEIQEAQKRVNQLGQIQDQQIQLINAGLAVDADRRALILKNLDDEIAAGVAIGDQYEQQRKQIEAKNAAIQAGQDATRLKDYLDDLKEEASLAGLSADERERAAAVLQAMHLTHGQLRADQAQEIQTIVAARQATERWRGLVSPIVELPDGVADRPDVREFVEKSLQEILV